MNTSSEKLKGKRGPKCLLTVEQMQYCVMLRCSGFTLQSIADCLDVNRSTVTRALAKMKKQGFIGI